MCLCLHILYLCVFVYLLSLVCIVAAWYIAACDRMCFTLVKLIAVGSRHERRHSDSSTDSEDSHSRSKDRRSRRDRGRGAGKKSRAYVYTYVREQNVCMVDICSKLSSYVQYLLWHHLPYVCGVCCACGCREK